MAKARGLGSAGKARIKDSLQAFAYADDATKEALFNKEENFDPWMASTGGHNNDTPAMLGERTNGQDSTRFTFVQYFFNPDTLTGDIYMDFRGTEGRRKPTQYVFNNVPVYQAINFYDALSKGKTFNTGGMSGGYVDNDAVHFTLPPATPLGAKFQYGPFKQGRADPLGLQEQFPSVEKQDKNNMQLPLAWGS